MTTISMTIPNETTARVLDGFCKRYGYSATLENGDPNPETKAQFTKRKVIEFVKAAVREAEMETAANTARTAAATSVDSEIVIT